jgi:methionyl-tRNA formyltransferase
MKILFLSPHKELAEFIKSYGDEVLTVTGSLTAGAADGSDFIISYEHPEPISAETVSLVHGRAIKLHPSYLPWNRGSDPNFWSFIDRTPKGVTICFIDGGPDTGDIIAQRYLKYDYDTDTLATFADKLTACLEDLFKKTWHYIRDGQAKRYPQTTCHSAEDKARYEHLLTLGADTPVKDIIRGCKNDHQSKTT